MTRHIDVFIRYSDDNQKFARALGDFLQRSDMRVTLSENNTIDAEHNAYLLIVDETLLNDGAIVAHDLAKNSERLSYVLVPRTIKLDETFKAQFDRVMIYNPKRLDYAALRVQRVLDPPEFNRTRAIFIMAGIMAVALIMLVILVLLALPR